MSTPEHRSIVRKALRYFFLVLFILARSTHAHTAQLTGKITEGVDAAAEEVLEKTGVPSASVAVVYDGAIALTKAYGLARLDPPAPAATTMRYPIGSISKQFTATAVAMLAADGKLSLDDTVAEFFPHLTRADDITLRQLLSHTAGIRDYWPQDYVPPAMLQPITTQALIDQWARQPLDFEPGSMYQYSNTGYVVAGAIVEKVSGKPLMEFLSERIFVPLGMHSVIDIDQGALKAPAATGYQRFALGPPRLAPKEGKGWLFAAGPLAMTAEDLAKWDVSLIEGEVPGHAIFRELTREVVLSNGVGSGYALGVGVALEGNRRVVRHGGEVSGFTAVNLVYPEDRAAIVVFVNQDAVGAATAIAKEIAKLLFVSNSPADSEMLARVNEILRGLKKGEIDRTLFTPNANAYFSEAALADMKASLKKLGSLEEVKPTSQSLRGGLTTRIYRARFKKKSVEIVTRATASGKLEQFTISTE
jgi:CubicO group peptidase (beta-lactamase class C family)